MSNNNFRWENIAVNTWVSKIPSGWILKSVDTKNRININPHANSSIADKEPLAMSSSMVVIQDPMHTWTKDNFRWVNVARDTWRAPVQGGWVVKCVDSKTIFQSNGWHNLTISSSMQFIPDETHAWIIVKPSELPLS